jgi:hypothetical protein
MGTIHIDFSNLTMTDPQCGRRQRLIRPMPSYPDGHYRGYLRRVKRSDPEALFTRGNSASNGCWSGRTQENIRETNTTLATRYKTVAIRLTVLVKALLPTKLATMVANVTVSQNSSCDSMNCSCSTISWSSSLVEGFQYISRSKLPLKHSNPMNLGANGLVLGGSLAGPNRWQV